MRKLCLAILLGLCPVVFGASVMGQLSLPSTAGVNGTLRLSAPSGTALLAACGGPSPFSAGTISIPVTLAVVTTTAVVGNDCLTPSQTQYNVVYLDTNGNTFTGVWSISGTTFDVSKVLFAPEVVQDLVISGVINSAAIQTLSSIPVVAIAAQGPGTLIKIMDMSVELFAGTDQYANAGTLGTIFLGTNQSASGMCLSTIFTGSVNAICTTAITAGTAPTTSLLNVAVALKGALDPTCSGTCGYLRYWIRYRIYGGYQ